MIWMLIAITIFDILIFFHCLYAWRHVWGLRGGYGKGIWSEEYGGYMDIAKDSRRNSTLLLIFFTALTIGAWLE